MLQQIQGALFTGAAYGFIAGLIVGGLAVALGLERLDRTHHHNRT